MFEMADRNRESYEIYWTRDESVNHNGDSEDVVLHSFVPGVDRPGNQRATKRMQRERAREVPGRPERDGRRKGQDRSPTNPQTRRLDHSRLEDKTTPAAEALKVKDKPSLKDLRPEDKKRVANLIRELAKVGEEKEVIVEQLNLERRSYEDRVDKLQKQMAAISRERELTQKQYLECQKLLAEYQSQLATEQEKLTMSFHLPSSPHKYQAVSSATPKNKSVTRPIPGTSGATNHLATPGQPDGYHGAPERGGYPHPTTAHQGAPSLKQGHHPGVGAYQGGTDRIQPPGTQPDSSARTQPPLHPTNDAEFNLPLASTHRPEQAGGPGDDAVWAARQPRPASYGEPAMYVSYGHQQNPAGYVLRPSLDRRQGSIDPPQTVRYPNDSQETLATSRPRSADFHPLLPELETDPDSQGSQSPAHLANRLQNQDHVHPSGFQGYYQDDGSPTTPSGPWNQLQGSAALHSDARQPAYQTSAEHRHAVLERQRHQLRLEQAWLRRKLNEQEAMLSQKRSQLDQHRLHRPDREWQGDHRNRPPEQQRARDHGTTVPHPANAPGNRTDQEWGEPRKVPSGSEDDDNDDTTVASTNFPPEDTIHQLPSAHTPRNPDLNQIRMAQVDRDGGVGYARGVATTTGHPNQSQSRGRRELYAGYASLYPEARIRNHVPGSVSSRSPSSSSTADSRPALVTRSTSPLYRDQGTAPVTERVPRAPSRTPDRGRLSLSPGRVNVTPAPTRHKSRGLITTRQEQRPLERRVVSLPWSPRQHSTKTGPRKSNINHLSDLIAEMESPSVAGTSHGTTADLFMDEVTDTDTEIQESQILEDVFFL